MHKKFIILLFFGINLSTHVYGAETQPSSYSLHKIVTVCAGVFIAGIGIYKLIKRQPTPKPPSVTDNLHNALIKNDTSSIQSALQARADINKTLIDGKTILAQTILRRNEEAFNAILAEARTQAGLDTTNLPHYVNQTSKVDSFNHNVPNLHLAAQKGLPVITKALIEARADYGAKDSRGYTAITEAAWYEKYDVMEYLLTLPNVNMEQEEALMTQADLFNKDKDLRAKLDTIKKELAQRK